MGTRAGGDGQGTPFGYMSRGRWTGHTFWVQELGEMDRADLLGTGAGGDGRGRPFGYRGWGRWIGHTVWVQELGKMEVHTFWVQELGEVDRAYLLGTGAGGDGQGSPFGYRSS